MFKRHTPDTDVNYDDLYSFPSSSTSNSTNQKTATTNSYGDNKEGSNSYDYGGGDSTSSSLAGFEYDSAAGSSYSSVPSSASIKATIHNVANGITHQLRNADRKTLVFLAGAGSLMLWWMGSKVMSSSITGGLNGDAGVKLFDGGPGAKYLDPIMHQKASVMTMGPRKSSPTLLYCII
jgi:hypothetical protein